MLKITTPNPDEFHILYCSVCKERRVILERRAFPNLKDIFVHTNCGARYQLTVREAGEVDGIYFDEASVVNLLPEPLSDNDKKIVESGFVFNDWLER